MVRIIEHSVDLDFPVGEGLRTLIAQIPNRLHLEDRLFKIMDREEQTVRILSILRVALELPEGDRPHFLLLPESCLPFDALDRVLDRAREDLPPNMVLILGLEHITLFQFRKLLQRFEKDNAETLATVLEGAEDLDRTKPVNLCVTVVKERSGDLRCFLCAKTHPFAGEETLDHLFDLYRGQTFLLFSCKASPFNFMPLICFDYVYRDLQQSNIMTIIQKANEIYFRRHHNLNLLAVIQCNPKPEHKVFRDVVTGFYGEHLFKTPGTRDTLTVFINTSAETQLEGTAQGDTFGHSSIVAGIRHKLPRIKLSEFKTDDFSGAPVSRLRFGEGTRLYLCRLFPHHETDPRSSRAVAKVTGIFRPVGATGWKRMSGEDLLTGISDYENDPLGTY